ENPQHPYTQSLLEAVPIPDPKQRRVHFDVPPGEPPSPVIPAGASVRRVSYRDVGDRHLVADVQPG
ncbi:MAG: ABC transporter ATP-binding protein, partial [Roseibium sp.]